MFLAEKSSMQTRRAALVEAALLIPEAFFSAGKLRRPSGW
jgi:hypothetical protein